MKVLIVGGGIGGITCMLALRKRGVDAQHEPLAALSRFVKMRLPRTAWMQGLARRQEELYQTNNAASIKERNEIMRVNRTPETAVFPPEQKRLYGYDADIELRNSA